MLKDHNILWQLSSVIVQLLDLFLLSFVLFLVYLEIFTPFWQLYRTIRANELFFPKRRVTHMVTLIFSTKQRCSVCALAHWHARYINIKGRGATRSVRWKFLWQEVLALPDKRWDRCLVGYLQEVPEIIFRNQLVLQRHLYQKICCSFGLMSVDNIKLIGRFLLKH